MTEDQKEVLMNLVIQKLKKMTPEEIFQLSVKSGIHNPDGTLTEHYKDTPNLSLNRNRELP